MVPTLNEGLTMAENGVDLHDTLGRNTRNQVVIINLLRQQGKILAEIHQLVSPPEQSDSPSLRDILIRLAEGFERQEEAIRLLTDQMDVLMHRDTSQA